MITLPLLTLTINRNTLFSEKWTDFNGEIREEKKYYTNGQIKSHWKDEGYIVKTEEKLVSGEAPKRYSVRVTSQLTYDESGILIKKERTENGRPVGD